MGLPNYVVNLEEMVEAILKGYNSMKLMTNGKQGSKGLSLKSAHLGEGEVVWIAPHDLTLTGVHFNISDVRNIGYDDDWDMLIDSTKIMSSVHVKEMSEYKRFRNFYPVKKGQVIKFIYRNKTNVSKELWYNVDYIETDIPSIEVITICRDVVNDLEIRRYNSYYSPPVTASIVAPVLSGYGNPTPTQKTITFDMDTPSQIVTFYYQPKDREISVICLDQDGRELQRERFMATPPTVQTYTAPTIVGYNIVGEREKTVNIEIGENSPMEVFFYYEVEQKTVDIVCINQDTGSEIQRSRRIYTPNTVDSINAPMIARHNLTSDSPIVVEILETSPTTQEIKFFYEEEKVPPIEILHDYDYKVTMRWESNCETDMDLHLFFERNRNLHLYYGCRQIEVDEDNRAWYDYDHINHRGSNDYEEKPEVSTILGKPYNIANVKVRAFFGEQHLTQDVVIEIYSVDSTSGKDVLKERFSIPHNKLQSGGFYVCDINLENGRVAPINKVLQNIEDF